MQIKNVETTTKNICWGKHFLGKNINNAALALRHLRLVLWWERLGNNGSFQTHNKFGPWNAWCVLQGLFYPLFDKLFRKIGVIFSNLSHMERVNLTNIDIWKPLMDKIQFVKFQVVLFYTYERS